MSEQHIKGLDKLNAYLQTFPVKFERNVLRGGLRAGAVKELLPETQANLMAADAVQTGELIAGLKVGTRSEGGKVIAYLKSSGLHGYIMMWLEYGVMPHLISVQESEKNINFRRSIKLGKLVRESMTTINRRVLKIGNTFIGPTVHHPGFKGRGSMRGALDHSGGVAVVAAGEYMRDRLEKVGVDAADITIAEDGP